MSPNLRYLFLPPLAGILICSSSAYAVGADSTRGNLQKIHTKEFKFLDVNRINCTIASDGPYCDYRLTRSSGLEWPKGSGKTAVYTAGLWIAGKHKNSGLIRTAVQDFQTEYQEGPLLETFNTATNDDTLPVARVNDPLYRLYKIEIDKPDGGENVDSWADWPALLGAPYVDLNGNSAWDPGVDAPKFWGDQMVWSVINDVNRALHTVTGATLPMGLEIQNLYFAFNDSAALGDMMFMRWKIINKSDSQYDSVFIGMWSDVDLGDANDDLPACDTTLNLGYVYNSDNDDNALMGYLSLPPAIGFDILQGPIVPGTPTDSARVEGRWRHGFRNLAASSFIIYGHGTMAQLQDPPLGFPSSASVIYDYLLGKAGTIHEYLYSTVTGALYNFFLSGDPVAGTGELPSNFPVRPPLYGQDVRIMISAGPFTFAPGDTQEVVGAIVMGLGPDRLGSVTALKLNDRFAQEAFDQNFAGVTDVKRSREDLQPAGYALWQNYPNPFNPSTVIRYSLPQRSHVQLEVFDVLGRSVKVLVNGEMEAGHHEVQLDGSALTSGVYFYRLKAGEYVQTRRMLILK